MDKQRSIAFMMWVTMLIIVAAVAAAGVIRPLPASLERIATSPAALEHLRENAR